MWETVKKIFGANGPTCPHNPRTKSPPMPRQISSRIQRFLDTPMSEVFQNTTKVNNFMALVRKVEALALRAASIIFGITLKLKSINNSLYSVLIFT